MTRDPLLQHLGVLTHRALLFILLALAQGMGLWLWFWMHLDDLSALDAWRRLVAAWPLSLASFYSVQALLVFWLGLVHTALLYLLLGRWWSGKADVLHHRGSRFVDGREG